ncbi:GldG family protein [bacterium]|nr:GldG family protein [candidate division CSSED10-310 bacterium]
MAIQHPTIKSKTLSFTSVFLMLGILVFINILSYRIFLRKDLTEKKEYTISESTKSVLNQLDDIINITAYFSEDLPPYHTTIRTQVQDILSEYQAFAGNNLNIQYLDPGKDEDLKARIARMGIPEVPLGEIKRDKQVISMGYMGIAIQYGDKGEVIPFIPDIANLEYDLTASILKVKETSDRILAWIGDQDSNPQDPNGYKLLQDELNKNYVVRPMAPGNLTSIPPKTSVVVVDGSQALPPRALYAIDQYMMKNGKVIFLVDGVELAEGQGLSAAPVTADVATLLEHYGINIEQKLVADRRNAQASFSSGYVRFRLPYPLWPKIGGESFDQETPAVSQLESLVLPWTSPLQFETEKVPGLQKKDLVSTSDVAWVMEAPYDLNPQQQWNVTENDLVRSVLAMECRGNLVSYFKDKPVPENPEAPQGNPPKEEETVGSTGDAQFIVIASTRFVTNQFLSLFGENLVCFQNLVDSMVIGNQLIGIRSRVVSDRPLEFGTNDEKAIELKKTNHRLMGTILVPVLVVFIGLFRMMMRKQTKRKIQSMIQGGNHE